MTIGFKSGVALSTSDISQTMILALLVTIFMAMLVPTYSYLLLGVWRDVSEALTAQAIFRRQLRVLHLLDPG